jgi:hypothetical protein
VCVQGRMAGGTSGASGTAVLCKRLQGKHEALAEVGDGRREV